MSRCTDSWTVTGFNTESWNLAIGLMYNISLSMTASWSENVTIGNTTFTGYVYYGTVTGLQNTDGSPTSSSFTFNVISGITKFNGTVLIDDDLINLSITESRSFDYCDSRTGSGVLLIKLGDSPLRVNVTVTHSPLCPNPLWSISGSVEGPWDLGLIDLYYLSVTVTGESAGTGTYSWAGSVTGTAELFGVMTSFTVVFSTANKLEYILGSFQYSSSYFALDTSLYYSNDCEVPSGGTGTVTINNIATAPLTLGASKSVTSNYI